MSYFDGIELANLRFDAAVQAKCDPKKGWKRSGDKCVRKRPEFKGFSDHPGRGYASTKSRVKNVAKGLLLTTGAIGLTGAGLIGAGNLAKASLKRGEEDPLG